MFRGFLEHPIAQPSLSEMPQSDFAEQQQALSRFNGRRLAPGLGEATVEDEEAMLQTERAFLVQTRAEVAPWLVSVPEQPAAFVRWFESLKEIGPGQGDPLFPWLAEQASYPQMRWFLEQEVAGEAGFDDLVAMTQVKMPVRAKLEMARNYWDEMGRGRAAGMHGPLLSDLAHALDVTAEPQTTVWEALALPNPLV